jgi:hypothetical protein
MAKKWGAGIYVKSLFTLLAHCGVSQAEVWRHLGLKKAQISLWANGRKPMALRHRERFETFVWGALRRTNDQYLDAIEAELGEEGYRRYLRVSPDDPRIFPDPGPDVPRVVQRWWVFHVQAIKCLQDWEIELSPEPLCDEVGEIVLQLAPLATMDPDKRQAILLSSSQRTPVLQQVERLGQLLRDLDQIDPRPDIEALRSALQPRRQETVTPPATRTASARR